jgi:hypothetical protein
MFPQGRWEGPVQGAERNSGDLQLDDPTNETVEEAERHGPEGLPHGSWLVKPLIGVVGPFRDSSSSLARRSPSSGCAQLARRAAASDPDLA